MVIFEGTVTELYDRLRAEGNALKCADCGAKTHDTKEMVVEVRGDVELVSNICLRCRAKRNGLTW